MIRYTTGIMFLLFALIAFAQKEVETTTEEILDTTLLQEQLQEIIDSYQNFTYDSGTVDIGDGLANIHVPEGFTFLEETQANTVLTEVWGNPEGQSALGLMFPPGQDAYSAGSYAVVISFEEEGFIEDEDAEDLDYDDLLEEMQGDARSSNAARVEQGYQEIELVGWASPPFYDAERKKLHYAKELRFGEDSTTVLNYNVRVLGRRGYVNLNMIGDITVLPEVQKDIEKILASAEFKDGHTYFDFDPDIDKVAAYGIADIPHPHSKK